MSKVDGASLSCFLAAPRPRSSATAIQQALLPLRPRLCALVHNGILSAHFVPRLATGASLCGLNRSVLSSGGRKSSTEQGIQHVVILQEYQLLYFLGSSVQVAEGLVHAYLEAKALWRPTLTATTNSLHGS